MRQLPEFDKYLGKEHVILTSAESLRGVENNSVGGILAVHSISYSAQPRHMAARIDQVLVDGGVMKAVTDDAENSNKDLEEKTRSPFVSAFQELGYDVQVFENVVLAIKPFKNKSAPVIRALNLLNQDYKSCLNWEMEF